MRQLYCILMILVVLAASCATESSTVRTLRQAEYRTLLGESEQIDRIIEVLLEDTEASKDAAYTLGRLGDRRATPFLVQTIRDNGQAAAEAIKALGMIGDTRVVPDLIQIVKQDRPHVQTAVETLGQLGDIRALPILMQVVEEERPYTILAISSLGKLGSNEASAMLIKKFSETSRVRPEQIKFRIVQQEADKEHLLSFDMPNNLPPKIEILDKIMEPEGYAIIRYVLKDTEFDSLDIKADYSVNGGMNWHAASTEGNLNSIVEQNYEGSIVWRADRDIDLETVQLDPSFGLLLKLTPIDKHPLPRNGVPATWLFGVDTTSISIAPIEEEEKSEIIFRIHYPNPTRASLDIFTYHYSLDMGENWNPATVRLGIAPVDQSPDLMFVIWSSEIDIPNQDVDEIIFRISANNQNVYGNLDIHEPFHVDNNEIPQVTFLDFDEEESGLFNISYKISDRENDPVTLNVQYSLDQGRTWSQATISGDLSNINTENYEGDIKWFYEFDITTFRDVPIRLRLRASDRDPGLFIDSPDFYLKNSDFTKLTQGIGSGMVELSYSVAQDDTSTLQAQYSLDRGRTWKNATLPEVAVKDLTDRKQVTVNWNIGSDISSYLPRIEAIGSTLEMIQDHSIVPDLLMRAKQKASPYREIRQQAVEATRILEKTPPWVIKGLISSLVHDDPIIRSDALKIVKTINQPEIATAIADYEHYWRNFTQKERELVSFENETSEQLYQHNLRKPIPFDADAVVNNMMRWWGLDRSEAEVFIKDIDVLKEQTELNRLFREGYINDVEYWDRLEHLMTAARERRLLERRQRQVQDNNQPDQ